MKQGDCLSFAASPFAHGEQRRVAAPAMVALTGAILTKKTRSVRQYFAIKLSTLDNKRSSITNIDGERHVACKHAGQLHLDSLIQNDCRQFGRGLD
jgi:hypothetical protein